MDKFLNKIRAKMTALMVEKYMEYKRDYSETMDLLIRRMKWNLETFAAEGKAQTHKMFWSLAFRNEAYEERFDSFIIHFHVDFDLEEYSFHISKCFDSFHDKVGE